MDRCEMCGDFDPTVDGVLCESCGAKGWGEDFDESPTVSIRSSSVTPTCDPDTA